MPLNVQDFRAQMNYDGARPNLFRVEMAFPILTGAHAAQSKLTFMARAAQLPGDTVNQIPVFYMGRELKFAGNRTFPEWTVTIINDEDFIVKDAFEKWLSGINSHVSNLRDPAFIKADGGYQVDAYITQMGKRGDDLKRYRMIGCFPIDVSPIEMDWGANDTIEEFAVTFAYQWWEWAGGPNGPTTDSLGSELDVGPSPIVVL